MKIDHATPVVVLPCGPRHGATGIVRSLGRLRVPVYLVEGAAGGLASFSRYCAGRMSWTDEATDTQRVEFLLRAGRRIGGRPILIAPTDDLAVFIAENAGVLREWFRFPEVSSSLIQWLCNKKEMYYLAKRLGVATPHTIFPTSRQNALDFAETAAFPIMLKGIDGTRLARRCGYKMQIVGSKAELLKRYDAAEDLEHPNLMLQEYIPGNDDAVCGLEGYYDDLSECKFAATGRKLRQWPAYQGVTTLGICQEIPAIERITNAFMKAIGYRGILDIGYRYDARDGLYKVLDVNPRIGCTFRLFVAENGMDVARALYLDLTGQPVPMGVVQEGRKWVVEDLDVLSSARYLWDGRVTPAEWLRSFLGVQESAYAAADDPLPFAAMCVKRAWQLLMQTAGKLGRKIGELAMILVKGYFWLRGKLSRWSKRLPAPVRALGANIIRLSERCLMRLFPANLRLRWEFNLWAEGGLGESMGSDHLWLAQRIVPQMSLSHGESVLDLGCGDGWACRFMAEHSSVSRVVGLDVSDEMIRRARAKATKGNLEFICSSSQRIPYPDAAFSKVLSISAFYYFPRPEAVLRELLRVVSPGGQVFVAVCLDKDLPDWASAARKLGVPVHILSASEYKSLFQAAGWIDVQTLDLFRSQDGTPGHDRALLISARKSSCVEADGAAAANKANKVEAAKAAVIEEG